MDRREYYQLHRDRICADRRRYRRDHPDRCHASSKKSRLTHLEECKARCKLYQETHREEIREQRKDYRKKNKIKLSMATKLWKRNHPEQTRALQNKWVKMNPDKVRAAQRKAHKRAVMFRPNWYLRKCLAIMILVALRTGASKCSTTEELIGCSIEHLKLHLQSQFKPGMNWNNHGTKGWHIDHILPCARFNLNNPVEQKKCFHYTNLQPLWAKDNMAKGSKVLCV